MRFLRIHHRRSYPLKRRTRLEPSERTPFICTSFGSQATIGELYDRPQKKTLLRSRECSSEDDRRLARGQLNETSTPAQSLVERSGSIPGTLFRAGAF
jgi:hypothetical protein